MAAASSADICATAAAIALLLLLLLPPPLGEMARAPSQHPAGLQKAGRAVRIDTSANLNKHLFTPADGQIEFDALMETLMCGPRGEIKIW